MRMMIVALCEGLDQHQVGVETGARKERGG